MASSILNSPVISALAQLISFLLEIPAVIQIGRAVTRRSAVHRAIRKTVAENPAAPASGIRKSIRRWCTSDEVAVVLRSIGSGEIPPPVSERLVDLFCENSTITGITDELARGLVSDFLANLHRESLDLKDDAALHKAQLGIVAEFDRRFDRLSAEFREVAVEPRLLAAGPEENDQDGGWHRRLDEGKKLALQQKWQAALELFRQIESEAKSEGSAGSRFWYRLNVNIGASLFSLGRAEEAESYFERALDYQANDPLALGQLAQLAMQLNRRESASELAARTLEQNPLSEIGWNVRIQVSETELASEEIPEAVRDLPLILIARGLAAFRRGRRGEGLNLFRQALRSGSRDPQVLVVLAESLMMQAVAEDPFGQFPSELRREVGRLATDAVESLETMERSDLLSRALAARGAASSGVDDVEAVKDLKRASELTPHELPPKFQLARVLLRQGRSDGALFLLDQVTPGQNKALVETLRSRALLALGRRSELEAAIREGFESRADAENPSAIVLDLADTAIEAEMVGLAEELLASLDPGTLGYHLSVLRGRAAAARGAIDAARGFYKIALTEAGEEHRQSVAVEFAWQMFRADKPREACHLFELANALERGEAVRRAYTQSLVQSEDYERATEVLDMIEGEGVMPDWALEQRSMIALSRDDLPGAIDSLEDLLARNPEDPETRIHLVFALQRRGDLDRSIEVLTPLRNREDLSGHDLARVAQLFALQGLRGDALGVAYRAVRQSPDDPEIKRVYMKFFLERDDDAAEFRAGAVGPDTWVRLEEVGGSRTREYFIVRDSPRPGHPSEIAATHEIAQRLSGKRVGDVETFHVGQLSETRYRIAAIKSGYVHLFQHLMVMFPIQHPEFDAIQSFHIDEKKTLDSFTPIFASLEQKAAFGDEILEYYSQKSLPLGFVAAAGHVSLRDAYDTVVRQAGRMLLVERGDERSRARSRWAVGQQSPIVLTITGLLTLSRLGRLDLLLALERELSAPQSLLDELADEIRDLELAKRRGGMKVMAKAGDRFEFVETGPEVVQMTIDELASIREFIQQNASILPRPFSALSPSAEKLRNGIGASSYDAYALSGPGRVLFADDVGLRALAATENQALGFPTVALLEEARAREWRTREEFHGDIGQLIEMSQSFISLSADALYDVLLSNQFQLNGSVLRVLDRLSPDHAAPETAVTVAAALLRLLALSPLGNGALESVAAVLFERLTRGRFAPVAMRQLNGALGPAFALLPLEYARLRERMDAFLSSRTGHRLGEA